MTAKNFLLAFLPNSASGAGVFAPHLLSGVVRPTAQGLVLEPTLVLAELKSGNELEARAAQPGESMMRKFHLAGLVNSAAQAEYLTAEVLGELHTGLGW